LDIYKPYILKSKRLSIHDDYVLAIMDPIIRTLC